MRRKNAGEVLLRTRHRRNKDEAQGEEEDEDERHEKPEDMGLYETTMLVEGWINLNLLLKMKAEMAQKKVVQKQNRVRTAEVVGEKS
jgi:hypothetical protein